MNEKKGSGLFNFISLSTFVKYAESRIEQYLISNLILILKFANIVEEINA